MNVRAVVWAVQGEDMRYKDLSEFLAQKNTIKGPIALIIAEDTVELHSTIGHYQKLGFGTVVLFVHPNTPLSPDLEASLPVIEHDLSQHEAAMEIVNRLIPAVTGQWVYYGYNAEYLFFPFCETRSIKEVIAFHTEERRSAFLSYVIDLYALDLEQNPNAVNLTEAHLDRSGYYALGRATPQGANRPPERQLDFYGGLRWRFEEHIPPQRRKIDRISLFKAKAGLKMRPNHTFNDEEYNTYSCPWHHNITTAVMSFRTAKALKLNPGSRFDIKSFQWRNSQAFEWDSQQLMDLGLIEPGQWF